MMQHGRQTGSRPRGKRGFTLMELLVVISVIAILAAIGMPSFISWRQNIEYRDAARDMMSMLRQARSRTIEMNQQHQVWFDQTQRRYGLRVGDRQYNTDWDDTATNQMPTSWTLLTSSVSMDLPGTLTQMGIAFNPNGTSSVGAETTVEIRDSGGIQRYRVLVAPSGRIRIER